MSHTEFQNSIEACYKCAAECNHCENACLAEAESDDMNRLIKMNNECASVCILTAQMIASGSDFLNQICEFCANVCDACAKECNNHPETEYCKKCSEACFKCSEECRATVKVSELEIP